jgi:hypothetical protein
VSTAARSVAGAVRVNAGAVEIIVRIPIEELARALTGQDRPEAVPPEATAPADDWPAGRPRTVTCGLLSCGAVIEVKRDGQVPGYCSAPKKCRQKATKLRDRDRRREQRQQELAATAKSSKRPLCARPGCDRPRGIYNAFCHPPIWCKGRKEVATAAPTAAPAPKAKASLAVPPTPGKLVMPTLPAARPLADPEEKLPPRHKVDPGPKDPLQHVVEMEAPEDWTRPRSGREF